MKKANKHKAMQIQSKSSEIIKTILNLPKSCWKLQNKIKKKELLTKAL